MVGVVRGGCTFNKKRVALHVLMGGHFSVTSLQDQIEAEWHNGITVESRNLSRSPPGPRQRTTLGLALA